MRAIAKLIILQVITFILLISCFYSLALPSKITPPSLTPDLHPSHVKYFLRNNLELIEPSVLEYYNISREDVLQSCWGYEYQCRQQHRYKRFECNGSSEHWVKSKQQQEELFFSQGDFGYIKTLMREVKTFCHPNKTAGDASSLECSSYTRFCRGKNIFIDFKSLLTIGQPMRYREDVLSDGDIGGKECQLDSHSLNKEGGHKSPLQSWFDEIEHFTVTDDMKCDITIDRPTIIMKLDATVNLYHHFCDFVNLYLTLHLNNSWSYDRNILIWDMIPYHSNFGLTWKAFTDHPILDLSPYAGRRVCFKDVTFSLLPRMVFGMYYNMPLISGCSGSGVFHAFNRHLMHRLEIPDRFNYADDRHDGRHSRTIRVTLISRKTKFRQILNEGELIAALKTSSPYFNIRVVDFNHRMPFKEQLDIIANTDILIGIHGAGLTHTLFLPDYGVLFELFNCEDENCYKDLARLRGVLYLTWERMDKVTSESEGHHPTMGPHKKFTNYSFDSKEFLRLVAIAVNHVRAKRAEYARETLGLDLIKDHDELWILWSCQWMLMVTMMNCWC